MYILIKGWECSICDQTDDLVLSKLRQREHNRTVTRATKTSLLTTTAPLVIYRTMDKYIHNTLTRQNKTLLKMKNKIK